MDTLGFSERLLVALSIGLLIGLERGWKARDEVEGERTAGLRTHGLAALMGGLWGGFAAVKGDAGMIALGLGFMAYTGAMTLFFYREANAEKRLDATNLVAALLAFSLGAFAVAVDMAAAAAAAVVATALLALKASLHAWLRRMTWEELRSALILLTMTVVLLPVLPRRAIDPWGAINPYEIWLMTVLIAVISFAGYVAVKVLGDRNGIAVTALAGGLVSSTAVTVSLAQRAQAHPDKTSQLAGGALLSCATMVGRVLVVVGIINPGLLANIGFSLVAAGAVLGLAGLFFMWQQRERDDDGKESATSLGNPIDLAGVLKFGALLTVIIVASKIATAVAGSVGAYAVAAFSGIADVDAVTLTMSRMANNGVAADVAAHAIAIVAGVNTVVKAVLGWMTGGAAFGQKMTLGSALALAAGALGFLLV